MTTFNQVHNPGFNASAFSFTMSVAQKNIGFHDVAKMGAMRQFTGMRAASHFPCYKVFSARAHLGKGNLYDILGISVESSAVDLKKAYRDMVKLYHPDYAPPDKAVEYRNKFIEIHQAYAILKDPKRRSVYDMEMKRQHHTSYSSTVGYGTYTGMPSRWPSRNWETDQCWTS